MIHFPGDLILCPIWASVAIMLRVLSYSVRNKNLTVNTYYFNRELQEIKGGEVKVFLWVTADRTWEENLGFKAKKNREALNQIRRLHGHVPQWSTRLYYNVDRMDV